MRMHSAAVRRVHQRQRRARAAWRCRRSGGRSRVRLSAACPQRGATLLDLVQAVQREVGSDAEVVAVVRWLVNSGAVLLTGNFAGQRI
jgi:hypothetical protein